MIKLVFILLVLLLFGCKGNENRKFSYTREEIESLHLKQTQMLHVFVDSVVNVDLNKFLGNKHFDFESLIKSIHTIPLETTDESLISNIYKVVMTDSHVYIHDDFKGGGIAIFLNNGKFVKRISHGGGPGELTMLYDIAYDSKNNHLLAYQHPFLLYYTANGEYIKQSKLPFGFYNFVTLANGYLFKTLDGSGNKHLEELSDCTVLVTDTNFSLKHAGFQSIGVVEHYGGYSYLGDTGEAIWITNNNNDTVFHYNKALQRLEAAYVMNYEDKKIPSDYWLLPSQAFHKKLSQNDCYYYIGEYFETDSHQVFFLRNDYRRTQTVVYRDKRTGKMFGGSEARFNPHEIPAIAFPKATFKDSFVSIHYPQKSDSLLIRSKRLLIQDKKKIMQLKEDDNPVLFLFQLDVF